MTIHQSARRGIPRPLRPTTLPLLPPHLRRPPLLRPLPPTTAAVVTLEVTPILLPRRPPLRRPPPPQAPTLAAQAGARLAWHGPTVTRATFRPGKLLTSLCMFTGDFCPRKKNAHMCFAACTLGAAIPSLQHPPLGSMSSPSSGAIGTLTTSSKTLASTLRLLGFLG